MIQLENDFNGMKLEMGQQKAKMEENARIMEAELQEMQRQLIET